MTPILDLLSFLRGLWNDSKPAPPLCEWEIPTVERLPGDIERLAYPSGSVIYLKDGQRHRTDGPAALWSDGSMEWWQDGLLHRIGAPASISASGRGTWYQHGLLHREDGPAYIHGSGTEEWYWEGSYHREGGPAITWANGDKEWWLQGVRHREDGPAVDGTFGTQWWLHGRKVTKAEIEQWQMKKALHTKLSKLSPKPKTRRTKI